MHFSWLISHQSAVWHFLWPSGILESCSSLFHSELFPLLCVLILPTSLECQPTGLVLIHTMFATSLPPDILSFLTKSLAEFVAHPRDPPGSVSPAVDFFGC